MGVAGLLIGIPKREAIHSTAGTNAKDGQFWERRSRSDRPGEILTRHDVADVTDDVDLLGRAIVMGDAALGQLLLNVGLEEIGDVDVEAGIMRGQQSVLKRHREGERE